MNLFSRIGIWILITAAAVVLPLYELADYSEVWAHDGDIVLPALFFLFAGMALLSGKLFFRKLVILLNVVSRIGTVGIGQLLSAFRWNLCIVGTSPPSRRVALILCDLRI